MTVIHQNPTLLSQQILMDFFQITTIKVLDILQILKLGKASGLDSIIHQMPLKKTRVILSVFLSLLFNISLSKSIGNVFERIVFKEVFNHLTSNNLLHKFHSRSVHQLIEVYYRIYICLWMIIVLLPSFYVIFLKHLIGSGIRVFC